MSHADAAPLADSDYNLVPVQVVTAEEGVALSLAANQQREALHPVDEAEAFAHLVNVEKQKLPEIAATYGVPTRYVKQRLKLAGLAPELIAAGRAGDLPLLALQAFTITDDHDRQRAVLETLRAGGHLDDAADIDPVDLAEEIHEHLAGESIESDHRLVKFIGLDAYRAAGGDMVNDLFSDDDEPTLLRDRALVDKLAKKKLQAAAKKIEKQGWAWVALDSDWIGGSDGSGKAAHPQNHSHEVYTRSRPATTEEAAEIAALETEVSPIWDKPFKDRTEAEHQRTTEVQARLDAIEDARNQFTDAERPLLGVIVDVGYSGDLQVNEGWLSGEHADAFHALRNPPGTKTDAEQNGETMKDGAGRREEAAKPPQLPVHEIAELKAHRAATRARCRQVRNHLDAVGAQMAAGNPQAALDALRDAAAAIDEILLEA